MSASESRRAEDADQEVVRLERKCVAYLEAYGRDMIAVTKRAEAAEQEVARLTRDRDAWVETSRLIQQRAEAAEGAVKGLSEKVTQLYKSLEAAEAELAHWRREHDEKE